ncbi:hypothetical protein GOP47_0015696 [Adiantum capillus-veneris]|uniref:Amidohydrolase-related domain-containing protein n=1 Tax=Adiantum capillus-veneris TaxID=13818 RepID=A0A9D4UK95_ADICA|nr:hypothetical protein GOP47_0015696 [Adiantum capillus-veneris]
MGTSKLLHGAWVVTMDPDLHVYSDGAIYVEDDRIKALGPSSLILPSFSKQAHEILDLSGHWIIPGLINTHVHTSQQLARGIADDVDLLTWLHERIWPFESHMSVEDSYLSTLLCGIELIHSGVTCFAEAGGQHVEGMVSAVERLGIRACLARSTMDTGEGLPVSWDSETTDSCLKVQEELFSKFHGSAGGRIHVWFGLRQILNATDDLLLKTKELADKCGTGIHMHVAEIAFENKHVSETRNIEHGTVTYLSKIGLLDSNLLAAHSVWVNPNEVDLMAKASVKVSHCPASNLRMLGFAPIQEMLTAGVCVSIGTDGAPSNNRMSLVDEMYLASLIHKGKVAFTKGATDPSALPAECVLKMATTYGAKAVLQEKNIGSLEVGKKADLVVVNPNTWTMMPIHDPIASLVYCMRTENIDSVMCDGRWIMRSQKILTVDEAEVLNAASKASTELLKRANIHIPKRMNVCRSGCQQKNSI